MLYNNCITDIIGVDRMCWSAGTFNIKPRSYSAIAFRIHGKSVITANGKKYLAGESDALYMPQGIGYNAEYTDTEIIVVHFVTLHSDPEPVVFPIEKNDAVYKLFLEALAVWNNNSIRRNFRIMSLTYRILDSVFEGSDFSEIPSRLNDVISFINSAYKRSDLSVGELCAVGGLSETRLRVLFKKHFLKSPTEYINDLRLENAKNLISNGASVADAALESGFNDPKYFSRAAKKHFGCTPRELKAWGK